MLAYADEVSLRSLPRYDDDAVFEEVVAEKLTPTEGAWFLAGFTIGVIFAGCMLGGCLVSKPTMEVQMQDQLVRRAVEFGLLKDDDEVDVFVVDEAEKVTPTEAFIAFTVGFATGAGLICLFGGC